MRCRECNADLPAEARFCLSCGARVEVAGPEAPADPLLEVLDNAIGFQYRIERLLGRGGMGAVARYEFGVSIPTLAVGHSINVPGGCDRDARI